MQYSQSISFVIICTLKCFGLNMAFWHGTERAVFCKTWSYVKGKTQSDFKKLLLFTEENLDWFNTGNFWWWIMFWLELHLSCVHFPGQFSYQAKQWCQEPRMLTATCALPVWYPTPDFIARNKVIKHMAGEEE